MPASPPPKSDPISAGSGSSADQVALMNQKSMKRGGGSSSDSAINSKSVVTSGHGVSEPHEALDKSLNSDPSSRQLAGRSNNWDHGSAAGGLSPRSHRGTEHHKNYGGTGSRRGLHQSNFGNRSDSHDWNHRTFSGGRDVQPQQQQHHRQRATSRPFYRPPPPAVAPFVASPSPVRPFASPAGYHDIPSPIFYVPPPPPPEAFRGMPFVSPPPMYLASPDLQLRTLLLKQIDYYFSPENLCKDVYLRQNMDQEGWVPLSLIAGFNRVRNLTNNLQLILDTVKTSTIVEVQGDKIRRRLDWKNWPLLSSAPKSPDSFALSGHDALTSRLSGIKIEGNMGQNSTRVAASSVGIPSSGDFGSQTQAAVSAENKSAQHGPNSFDGRISARSLSRSDTF